MHQRAITEAMRRGTLLTATAHPLLARQPDACTSESEAESAYRGRVTEAITGLDHTLGARQTKV